MGHILLKLKYFSSSSLGGIGKISRVIILSYKMSLRSRQPGIKSETTSWWESKSGC